MTSSPSRITVLVVTHGAPDVVLPTLEALRGSTGCRPLQVVVVDNSDDDAVVRHLTAAFPGLVPGGRAQDLAGADGTVELRHVPNRGLGAALNTGLALATGDTVLQLNPDCLVAPQTLAALTATPLEPGELRAPVLYAADGSLQMYGGRRHHRWTGRSTPEPEPGRSRRSGKAIPTGACFLARTEDLRRAGGFDESLFLYGEEVSLLARILRSGLDARLVVVPGAQVVHLGGATTGSTHETSSLTRYHAARSAVLVARRYDRATVPSVLVARLVFAAGELARGRRAQARSVLRGTWDGLRA